MNRENGKDPLSITEKDILYDILVKNDTTAMPSKIRKEKTSGRRPRHNKNLT